MRNAWLTLAVWLTPVLALACPVCGQPPQATRWAYQLMSVILSLLPLAMVGGTVYYLVLRVRASEREETALPNPAAAAPVPAPPPSPALPGASVGEVAPELAG
jgi:hypothetical protein